jgi:hypothetical protein
MQCRRDEACQKLFETKGGKGGIAMLGKALMLAILTAALLVRPLAAAADETESMMNGAPNADATHRDKKGDAGPPIEGADPGMVKSAPKHDKSMVAKPPQAEMDPDIHLPGVSPSGTPIPHK